MILSPQIIVRIKAKFPNANLSKSRLDKIGKQLDSKFETEEELDEKLDELDGMFPFADMAKEDDRLRTLEAKVKKETDEKPEPESPKDEKGDEKDDTPNWAKSLIQTNKALAERLEKIEADKVVGSRSQQLSTKLAKVSDADKARITRDFGRMKFETDEEFEEYLSDIEADVATMVQADADSGAEGYVPAGGSGSGSGGKVKEASDKELDEVMENFKI